jgi:hypothetical protein
MALPSISFALKPCRPRTRTELRASPALYVPKGHKNSAQGFNQVSTLGIWTIMRNRPERASVLEIVVRASAPAHWVVNGRGRPFYDSVSSWEGRPPCRPIFPVEGNTISRTARRPSLPVPRGSRTIWPQVRRTTEKQNPRRPLN